MRSLLFFLLIPAAFGQLFSAGLKIGVPVTDSFSNTTLPVTSGLNVQSFSDAKKYLIGPTVELHLPFGFSINADGIYRPLRLVQVSISPGSTVGTTIQSADHSSWEVTPALRYRFLHSPIVKPFAEAGPSFRFLDASLSPSLSDRGFTFGAGVEVKILRLRITPELRFTRWGSDHNVPRTLPFQSDQNQAEFLAGFTF